MHAINNLLAAREHKQNVSFHNATEHPSIAPASAAASTPHINVASLGAEGGAEEVPVL